MEHREADARSAAGFGSSADDAVRFLRELRQLRNAAGLEHAELAARAHYPYDLIRAAEVGPTLPDLPVLSAFVRACGGTTEDWEERWRSLNNAPSVPLLGARPGGNSDAADAGARLGATIPVDDAPDPSVIMAALDRVAENMAAAKVDLATQSGLPSQSGLATRSGLPTRSGPRSAPGGQPSTPPASAEPFSPWAKAPAEPEPTVPEPTGWGSSAGSAWDPIRMSSAWPILREDPAESASAGGRAPWEDESWTGELTRASNAPSLPDPTPSVPSAGSDVWTPRTKTGAASAPAAQVGADTVPAPSADMWSTPSASAATPPGSAATPSDAPATRYNVAAGWSTPSATPATGDNVGVGWSTPSAPALSVPALSRTAEDSTAQGGTAQGGTTPLSKSAADVATASPATASGARAGGHARPGTHQGVRRASKVTLVVVAIVALIVIVILLGFA